jgi:hypothetical protein
VCLCRKPLSLYTFFDRLNLFCPFWEMFCEQQDNTVIHASHMGKYMLHAQESETLQTCIFRLLKGKQRTAVTFQTDGNIPISLHVFAFLLIVKEGFVFIHDVAFFFFLHGAYFTLIHFHNLFYPSFLLYNTENCYPVSPLVIPGNAGYPC